MASYLRTLATVRMIYADAPMMLNGMARGHGPGRGMLRRDRDHVLAHVDRRDALVQHVHERLPPAAAPLPSCRLGHYAVGLYLAGPGRPGEGIMR